MLTGHTALFRSSVHTVMPQSYLMSSCVFCLERCPVLIKYEHLMDLSHCVSSRVKYNPNIHMQTITGPLTTTVPLTIKLNEHLNF